MEAKGLSLKPLAPYEQALLSALSFFRTGRNLETQAHHCLSMYLRQSRDRIMGEVAFYAAIAGMEEQAFLQLITEDPDRAQALIAHQTSGVSPLVPTNGPKH
ncbi:MAG: hypothetical protein HC796_03290 [Synechococcaceae cyanobacterium RL_1_2]|nr:hypothetical protein [Synechococcaceae cyanobacterium RL_1_2]